MNEALNIVIALVPSISGVLGVIISVVVGMTKMKSLNNENCKETANLKGKLAQIISQNANLGKYNKELVAKYEELEKKYQSVYEDIKSELKIVEDLKKDFDNNKEDIKVVISNLKEIIKQNSVLLKKGE